jgi:predicted PurR-regulated permease PerM
MKRIISYAVAVFGTLLLLLILWQFRIAVIAFIASLFLAAMIRPLVAWLTERGLSRGFAPLVLYIIGLAIFAIFLLVLGDVFLAELNAAANRAVVEYEVLYQNWDAGAGWQQAVAGALPQPFSLSAAEGVSIEAVWPAVMSLSRGVAGLLAGLLVLAALSIYWSADQHRFERLWLSLLPPQRRAYARDSWRDIETAVGGYLRSQVVQSVLAALLIGIGAAVVGFDFPLLLGIFAALAAFVPFFGGLLTALMAFAMGVLESTWLGAGLAAYTLLVFLAIDVFIEPRLWSPKERSFFLTVLLIIPLFETFGLLGLLLTTPIAAALDVLIWQAYDLMTANRRPVVELEDLEARYQRLAERVAVAEKSDVTPELQSILQRLSRLLAAAQGKRISLSAEADAPNPAPPGTPASASLAVRSASES